MRTRTATPAVALALTLMLGACGQGDGNEATPGEGDHLAGSPGGNRTALPSDGATEVSPQPSGTGDPIIATSGALQAITAAEQEAGGTPFAVDDEGDDAVWEVEVAVEDRVVEVSVDRSGDVVSTEEAGTVDPEVRTALEDAQVGLAEAIELAMEEGSGEIDVAELEMDGDRVFWTVDMVVKQGDVTYIVDAATGEVSTDA